MLTPGQRQARIDAVLATYRARLIRLELEAAARAGRSVKPYAAKIAKLIEAAMQAPGFVPDAKYVSSAKATRALMEAARQYGDEYAIAAVRAIQAEQSRLILDAQRVQASTILLQTAPQIAPQIAGQLRIIGVERIANLVGAARPDSPMWSLKTLGTESTETVVREMIRGAARGDSPRTVARAASKSLTQDADWKVLRVTRSEMLRASRESSRAFAAGNPTLTDGWAWHAQLDSGTCAACWASHGEKFPTSQMQEAHPNCRCALLVQPALPSSLGFEGVDDLVLQVPSGESQFAKLDPEAQRKILGPSKHDAYREGRIQLKDAIKVNKSAEWGNSRSVASLGDSERGARLRGVSPTKPRGGPVDGGTGASGINVKQAPSHNSNNRAHLDAAISKVQSVHNVKLDIEYQGDRDISGKGEGYYRPVGGSIGLGKFPNVVNNAIHEIGHAIDFQVLSKDPRKSILRPGNDPDKKMLEWKRAVKSSGVKDRIRERFQFAGPSAVKYLRSDVEVFARSYQQWIATKTGDKTLLKQIVAYDDGVKRGNSHYWTEAEFAPILKALDRLFGV